MTLDDAYARARARSTELLTAAERIVVAELQVDRAWALLKPNLSSNFSYTHSAPTPEPFSVPPILSLDNLGACAADPNGMFDAQACFSAFQAEIARIRTAPSRTFDFAAGDTALFRAQVTWNILNGRALPLLANAEDGVVLESHRQRSDEARLLLTVARAFLGAIAAEDAIELARRAVSRADARVALAEDKAKVGEQAPKILEVERLGAKQARLDVRRAENVAVQARLVLAFAIGDDEPPVALVRPPALVPPPETTAALIQIAQAVREDVQVAKVALTVAERGRTDAWWKFAPTIGLFGAFRYSNVSGLSGQNEEWSVGFNANWLMYDGGLRYADLKEADSNERVARAALERLERGVAQDVRRAQLKLEAASLSVERAEALRALSVERTSLVRTQASAGSARPLDLPEAEDAERDAETAVLSARLDRDAAILELQFAAGRFAP